jgi:hypothetical protein
MSLVAGGILPPIREGLQRRHVAIARLLVLVTGPAAVTLSRELREQRHKLQCGSLAGVALYAPVLQLIAKPLDALDACWEGEYPSDNGGQPRNRSREFPQNLLQNIDHVIRARGGYRPNLPRSCHLGHAPLWAPPPATKGRRAEARDLLAPICGWLAEGFATPDLKEHSASLPSWPGAAITARQLRQRPSARRPAKERRPSKASELDEAAARGVMPEKPIVTSSTNQPFFWRCLRTRSARRGRE